jgi:hypothetical protein
MSRTQLFVIICGIALSVFILEMVRRRRLREEYSWLWILAAIGYFLVAAFPGLAARVAGFIGSNDPVSTFTFIGLFFLFVICIQFSVQISRLTEQSKNLTQQVAILDSELRVLTAANDSEHTAEQQGGQGEECSSTP